MLQKSPNFGGNENIFQIFSMYSAVPMTAYRIYAWFTSLNFVPKKHQLKLMWSAREFCCADIFIGTQSATGAKILREELSANRKHCAEVAKILKFELSLTLSDDTFVKRRTLCRKKFLLRKPQISCFQILCYTLTNSTPPPHFAILSQTQTPPPAKY